MQIKKNIFDSKLLNVLVCPKTKSKVTYNKKNNEIISKKAKLAYPIKNGIPIMLIEKARKL
tara:strand:- start:339 stop:521 length:183 start_codon:yes stop_codon:yes gene_type:complete